MYFGTLAASYDTLYKSKDYQLEARFISKVARDYLVNQTSSLSILDFGCGTGNHGIFLSKDFGQYIGIDPSPEMLSIAKEKLDNCGNVTLLKSLSQLDDLIGKKIDVLCFLFSVIGHIGPQEALANVLRQVVPMLSKKSLLIFDFWDREKLDNDYGVLRKREFKLEDRSFSKFSKGIVNVDLGQVIVETSIVDNLTGKEIQSQTNTVYAFSSVQLKNLLNEFGFIVEMNAEDGKNGTPRIDCKSRWIIGTRFN